MKDSVRRFALVLAVVVAVSLTITTVAMAVPTNDNLDDLKSIPDNYAETLPVLGATLEVGEVTGTCEATTPDWSVWYGFSVPDTGKVRILTRLRPAPNITNYIEVYEVTAIGPPVVLGSAVACQSGLNWNPLEVSVTGGANYAIRVSGDASDLGDNLTLELDTMGTLSGTVTDENSSLPLQGVSVQAITALGSSSLGSTFTAADGTWTMDVPTKSAVIRFIAAGGSYANEWYDNVSSQPAATVFNLAPNVSVANVDAALTNSGSMSGTITSAGGGGITGASIGIFAEPNPTLGTLVALANTDANGDYSLSGLAPGNYIASASEPLHITEWYDNASAWTGATPFTVVAGQDTVIDMVLATRGSISGIVLDNGGAPIVGVDVKLYSGWKILSQQTTTSGDGKYALSGILPGSYAVFVDTDPAWEGAYSSGWWNGLPASTSFAAADKITVTTGSSIADFNLSISSLSGTATSTGDSSPIEGVPVELKEGGGAVLGATTTDVLGEYSFTGFRTAGSPLTVTFSATGLLFDDPTPIDIAFNAGEAKVHDIALNPTVIPSAGFLDTVGGWFEPEIDWLAYVGITRGCNLAGDLYCPGDSVTRGEMAAFIARALDLPAAATDYFLDDDGSLFEDDINRLAEAGITRGCNLAGDMYCSNGSVTRGAMAAFITRALGYTDNGGGDIFSDDDGSIFEADIDKLATAGVTQGCDPFDLSKFCPNDDVTRAEMGVFLYRALTA